MRTECTLVALACFPLSTVSPASLELEIGEKTGLALYLFLKTWHGIAFVWVLLFNGSLYGSCPNAGSCESDV